MHDPNLRQIGWNDRATAAAAAELLAAAFKNDPAMIYFVSGEDSRDHPSLRVSIARTLIRSHLSGLGRVFGWFDGNTLVGCALVDLRPGRIVKTLAYLRTLKDWLALPHGVLRRLNDYGAVSQRDVPKNVTHFLTMVGISPQFQGKGHGGRLLSALEETFGKGAVWALDTENPDNVPFYRHKGFTLYDTLELSEMCLYKMRKP